MKRYGKEFILDQKLMDTISTYMNDEIREDLHAKFSPCEPEEFLRCYLELDPDFEELLETEFNMEV